ncbi:4623_t:CDS:2 [Funneliformis caledonium]|uniref:4623_t:CDS:1 n=1 Tax=Funneliformis caledonium TaxID=1117310 RepID=A0A9N9DMG4_9GLOM|nr:4623_t:CDS:2 [Funneliformis caledonium]
MEEYEYEQVLEYENEIYQVNEDSESENEELTNALAQIYYAVDNSISDIQNNEAATPNLEINTRKITKNNSNISLENKKPSPVPIHTENADSHKRKRIVYDESHKKFPSHDNRQCCVLCRESNHDEHTCENILYPDNDESTWRRYNLTASTVCKRSFRLYCYHCTRNHFGQDCQHKSRNEINFSPPFRNDMSQRDYSRLENSLNLSR